jgi:hypothetical protein
VVIRITTRLTLHFHLQINNIAISNRSCFLSKLASNVSFVSGRSSCFSSVNLDNSTTITEPVIIIRISFIFKLSCIDISRLCVDLDCSDWAG